MKNVTRITLCLIASICIAHHAHGATVTTYSDSVLFGFDAGTAGATLTTQNFDGFAHLTSLKDTEILTGVTATTNADLLRAWDPTSTGDVRLFASDGISGATTTRADGNLYYDFLFTASYNVISFYIEGFDPASTAGLLVLTFSDADSRLIPIEQNGASENDPIFFGLISDTSVTSIRWNEGQELDGGNEETSIDNFSVGNAESAAIPAPAALPAGIALLGVLGLRRRK